jgi:hypothetical protein
MYGEIGYSYNQDLCLKDKFPCCDETHPSDGQNPVKPAEDQKGGIGRRGTGHGKRLIANDPRGRQGHGGHHDHRQRPIEEQ